MYNERKKKLGAFGKKVITSFLALVLTAGTIVPASNILTQEAYAAESVSYTVSPAVSDMTAVTVNSGSIKGYKGLCATPFERISTDSGKATITKISNNTRMARVAYYLAKHPSLLTSKKSAAGSTVRESWWRAFTYARLLDKYKTSYTADDFCGRDCNGCVWPSLRWRAVWRN